MAALANAQDKQQRKQQHKQPGEPVVVVEGTVGTCVLGLGPVALSKAVGVGNGGLALGLQLLKRPIDAKVSRLAVALCRTNQRAKRGSG